MVLSLNAAIIHRLSNVCAISKSVYFALAVRLFSSFYIELEQLSAGTVAIRRAIPAASYDGARQQYFATLLRYFVGKFNNKKLL